jgi:hypothetical protein
VEKFGALPTAMKIISFSRTREVKLYEIERASLKGFVLQGKKLGEAFAEIVVTDKAGGKEIRLFIQQPGSLEEDILRSIVSSIKPDVQVRTGRVCSSSPVFSDRKRRTKEIHGSPLYSALARATIRTTNVIR